MPFPARHRPEPGLRPPVIGLDRVVRVLLHGVQRRRDQLAGDPRAGRGTAGGDPGRDRARAQRPGKEAPGGPQVTPPGQQDVHDLAMLADRPVQVGPLAGDLHVRLIDEPPVTRSVAAWPGRLDELRSEALDPAVDDDVIHGDSALGQQFLHITVGQAIPQVTSGPRPR